MKNTKILLLVLFLLIPELYSQIQSGWYWVNPQPQGHNLTSVAYLNNNIIVAAGWNGTIIRSQNGGLNWSYFRYNTLRDFKKLKFVDLNTGYAIGDSSLFLKTTDSGLNWTRVPYFSSENLWDMFFFDANTGFVTSNQRILKTTNGGNNFSVLTNFTGLCIQFTDANTGYCGGFGILKTTNAGINWSSMGNYTTYGCYFFDNNTGFITGDYNTRRTTNGGVTWTSDTAFSYYPINSLKFVNSNTGFASSFLGGDLYKTTNSGFNWSQIPFQQPDLFCSGFDFTDNNNIISVSRFGLINITSNGGSSWHNLSNILYSYLSDISFPNTSTGFAAGYRFSNNKSIFKTTNQGNNWYELTNVFNFDYASLYFINANTGFAGGYDGEICKTSNSGVSWSISLMEEIGYVFDIKFMNQSTGFASSIRATIYKTTNTGQNWIKVNYNYNHGHLFKLFFPSQNTGYAVGESMYKTTNGGNNWTHLPQPPMSESNFSAYFINDNVGYLGGDFGEISNTTDGGLTWNTYQTNLANRFDEIEFLNLNTGFICGTLNTNGDNLGSLLKTTNGGINWVKQSLPANESFQDIEFINDLTGFLVGSDGTILKTTTGGEYIGINQISTEIPLDYYLKQNYPNPFNPLTNIKFDIPKWSIVKISIYDILGKEISVLVNEELNPGTFEVNWDASNFPSGVYFYKIVTDDFSESKKMVLVK